MDTERPSESLRDTIGLEVERALAVDVAPVLHTQVRARIARERASAARWKRRIVPLGAALLAAAALVIAIRTGPDSKPAPAPRPAHEMTASPTPSVAVLDAARRIPEPARAGRQPARPAAARVERIRLVARRPQPVYEVLVPDERTALGLLLANIRQGRIDPVEPATRPLNAPLEPLDEITIAPIVIKPLARLESVEGEHQ